MVPDRLAFVVNFFSYFTILSNAVSAIVLLIGAWLAFTRRGDPYWYNLVRACVVTYMATTLVVYNLLLREVSLDQATTVPWSNEIMHVVGAALPRASTGCSPRAVVTWSGSASGPSRSSRSPGRSTR